MFVYVITNSETKKIYIGKTVTSNLDLYLKRKIRDALKGTYRGRSYLFNAMANYPSRVWSIRPLISCLTTNYQLCLWEKALIYAFDSRNPEIGYNISLGGDGCNVPHSPEARIKIGQASKERWSNLEFRSKTIKSIQSAMNSSGTSINKSKASKKMWSNPRFYTNQVKVMHSPEAKAKAASHINEVWSSPQYHIQHSEITKRAMNKPQVRAKIVESNRGRKFSPESRAKLSACRKRLWADPDFRDKMIKIKRADPQRSVRMSNISKIRWSKVSIKEHETGKLKIGAAS